MEALRINQKIELIATGFKRKRKAISPRNDMEWQGEVMDFKHSVWFRAGEDAYINLKYVVPTYESAMLCGVAW